MGYEYPCYAESSQITHTVLMSLRPKQPFKRPLTIHVSDAALLHLLLAGMESYHVRHWGKHTTTKGGPAETAGLLWGYAVSRPDGDHVLVEHVSTDTFAKGNYREVGLNAEVTRVKQMVVAKRWPHLSMVGDFHTHPYKSYTETQAATGWQFSEGDRESYEERQDSWPGCVALVLTLTEIQEFDENHQVWPEAIESHILRWQMDRFWFWLAGYAIDDASESTLLVSPRAKGVGRGRPAVYIDVPTINGTHAWFSYGDQWEPARTRG